MTRSGGLPVRGTSVAGGFLTWSPDIDMGLERWARALNPLKGKEESRSTPTGVSFSTNIRRCRKVEKLDLRQQAPPIKQKVYSPITEIVGITFLRSSLNSWCVLHLAIISLSYARTTTDYLE